MNQSQFLEEEERLEQINRLKSVQIGNFPDTEQAKEAMEIHAEKLKELSEEKHPPIPPNCPYFKMIEGYWYFILGSSSLCLSDDFYSEQRDYIKIIASVARCAWMDFLSTLNTHDPEYYVIQKNAELWRIWGEQK